MVGAQEQLGTVLETLIAAAKAGKLEAAGDAGGRAIPTRKAA